MVTPQEQRKIRLKNDYAEMQNIKGNIIQWKSIQGEAPYIEAYKLVVKIQTITGSQPNYRNEHTIYLQLPEGYPRVPPQINMRTTPPPFHPNWYANGNWCYGTWDLSEGLGHHVIRMIRTLQFDPEITNPNSPANREAKEWYLAQQRKNLFPCDRTNLPDPTKRRFTIQPPVTRRFEIQT
jgi:ubiquitin-protein ligase